MNTFRAFLAVSLVNFGLIGCASPAPSTLQAVPALATAATSTGRTKAAKPQAARDITPLVKAAHSTFKSTTGTVKQAPAKKAVEPLPRKVVVTKPQAAAVKKAVVTKATPKPMVKHTVPATTTQRVITTEPTVRATPKPVVRKADVCVNGDYTASRYDGRCGTKPAPAKDYCPNGDYTNSRYDGRCGVKPAPKVTAAGIPAFYNSNLISFEGLDPDVAGAKAQRVIDSCNEQ